MAVISTVNMLASPLNPKYIICCGCKLRSFASMAERLQDAPENLLYSVTKTPYNIPHSLAYNIFPALLISSIGKIIHNRNQKKKQKAQEIL